MKLRIRILLGLFMVTMAFASKGSYQLNIENQFKKSPMPEFRLEDINMNSKTYGKFVSPSDYKGKVVLIYFGSMG